MGTDHRVGIDRQFAVREDIIVPISTTTSNSFGLMQATAGGIFTPATLTSTTIAFEVSWDDSTWGALTKLSDNTQIGPYTISTGKGYALPFEFFMFPYGRYVLGSSEAAARTLVTILQN